MSTTLLNANPTIVPRASAPVEPTPFSMELDPLDVFELIRDIKDPEHPYTLEQLGVVREDGITVVDDLKDCSVHIIFTPTVPHCSLASLIALSIRRKLLRDLDRPAKITLAIKPGTHSTEEDVNKQVNDKERVAAALENPDILETVTRLIEWEVPG